ncbi:MAG TPA: TetR/AcrR family transcriptional regulator [Acidimicrobiales bacterium]|jgi:AcrR family transcriptional regulator
MAKTGAASTVAETGSSRSAGTRRLLIEAAIETLKDVGYTGASARAIAERAGSNQGLVFYHFGSVANLLLAALDAVSADRLRQYGTAVESVGSPAELVDVAAAIFRQDLDAGYVTVLVEMIAGASSTPGLGTEVAARMGPWFDFAQRAIETAVADSPVGSVLPAADLAYGVVALYLGLDMLSHLQGERDRALALFSHARQLAGLLDALNTPTPKEAP